MEEARKKEQKPNGVREGRATSTDFCCLRKRSTRRRTACIHVDAQRAYICSRSLSLVAVAAPRRYFPINAVSFQCVSTVVHPRHGERFSDRGLGESAPELVLELGTLVADARHLMYVCTFSVSQILETCSGERIFDPREKHVEVHACAEMVSPS
eukprot:2968188-Pleurochrysis_carterae.AAC.2